jgi:hypothetical protein
MNARRSGLQNTPLAPLDSPPACRRRSSGCGGDPCPRARAVYRNAATHSRRCHGFRPLRRHGAAKCVRHDCNLFFGHVCVVHDRAARARRVPHRLPARTRARGGAEIRYGCARTRFVRARALCARRSYHGGLACAADEAAAATAEAAASKASLRTYESGIAYICHEVRVRRVSKRTAAGAMHRRTRCACSFETHCME